MEVSMGATVVHWEINGNDANRLREFYSNLFGWKVNANNPMNYGLVSAEAKKGIGGGIGQKDPSMPAPNVTFYVAVDDLNSYLSKAESLGGKIVVPRTEIPNMVTFGLFADPEGNTIGIIESMAQPRKKRRKAAPRKKARGSRRSRR
jgi:uncharacterized protein